MKVRICQKTVKKRWARKERPQKILIMIRKTILYVTKTGIDFFLIEEMVKPYRGWGFLFDGVIGGVEKGWDWISGITHRGYDFYYEFYSKILLSINHLVLVEFCEISRNNESAPKAP